MGSRTEPPRWNADPNAVETRAVKSYGSHHILIEVCKERGLPVTLERPDQNCRFVVLNVTATYDQLKAAKLEWCRRLTIGADWTPQMVSDCHGMASADLL